LVKPQPPAANTQCPSFPRGEFAWAFTPQTTSAPDGPGGGLVSSHGSC
jgi:hypothetical protein